MSLTPPPHRLFLLQALPTLRGVSVSLLDGATQLCEDGQTTLTAVTFTHEPGPQPALQAYAGALISSGGTPSLSVLTGACPRTGYSRMHAPFSSELSLLFPHSLSRAHAHTDCAAGSDHEASQAGTKEAAQCSNRGACDTSTGLCTCDSGFAPSDGAGGSGSVPDCGYNESVIASCPSKTQHPQSPLHPSLTAPLTPSSHPSVRQPTAAYSAAATAPAPAHPSGPARAARAAREERAVAGPASPRPPSSMPPQRTAPPTQTPSALLSAHATA